MVCTYCNSETHVVNSRLQKRSNSVWRRRKCAACASVFSTVEQVDYEKSWVVQYANDSLLPFQRDMLFISIYKSLQHRPSASLDAVALTKTIVGQLHKTVVNGSLTSTIIATLAHQALQRFDSPAATSYQAFHADVL